MALVYMTGDLHGKIGRIVEAYERNLFQREDYLMICGDFGLLWDRRAEEVPELHTLSEMAMTILFIDGNHENFDLLDAYQVGLWNGGKIHQICPNIFHLMRGQIFQIEGKSFFTLGGGTSVNRAFCQAHDNWWCEELPNRCELAEGTENLQKTGNLVDYIVTHTCSSMTLQRVAELYGFSEGACPNELNDYLQGIEDTVTYREWFFAHFHKDGGVIRKRQRLLYQTFYPIAP